MDPLAAGMLADGSLAADPEIGGSWQDAGGRWELRVVLWVALAGRRVPRHHRDRVQPGFGPRGCEKGPASSVGSQFPVTLAEAYAAEFGRAYLGFSPQNHGQQERAVRGLRARQRLGYRSEPGWNGAKT